MIQKRNLLGGVCSLVVLIASIAPLGAADLPSYAELKKKLSLDPSPLKAGGGVVSTYADVIDTVRPAVVSIFTTTDVDLGADSEMQDNPWFRYFFGAPPEGEFKQRGLGSGVIITEDGYILTNNHVVEDADEIKIRLPIRQREYSAELVGSDKETDVALLKINAKGLPTATLADSAKLRVGDVVLAIGTPFNLEQSVTMGIVSALGRSQSQVAVGGGNFYADFIQTDAPINPGNSGGALIDTQGRVIGLNTAIQSSGMVQGNIGIGFAIPVNMSLDIVERLLEGEGKVKRGYLGVLLRRMDTDLAEALGREDYSGALVAEVVPGSPAEKAGFEVYDLVVEFEGKKVTDSERLRFDIGNTPTNKKVVFGVVRDGKKVELTGALQDRAKGLAAAGRLGNNIPGIEAPEEVREFIKGVTIRDLGDTDREALGIEDDMKGVLVEDVAGNSSAAEAGLQAGDVIVEVNKNPVNTTAEAFKQRSAFKGKVIMLRVYSGGSHVLVAVRLD